MRRSQLSAAVAVLTVLLAPLAGRADAPTTLTNVRFEVSDHVKIAADVYLPAPGADGVHQYPCVVEHTPYRKELRASEGAGFLPGKGIALIELDARGTGGSGGEYDIVFSMREQRDAAEIIEQLANDGVPGYGKLCLPKIGMYGGSYSGIIQYLVASLPAPYYPEHLAAIAPQRAYGDLYRDIVYHGGMPIGSFGQIWSAGTQGYYTAPPEDTNPADASDAASAWTDHLTMNDPIMKAYLTSPYIDAPYHYDHCGSDIPSECSQQLYADSSILPRIANLRVPALHLAGWFDAFTRGQLLTFQKALAQEDAAHGPNYLIIGPWNHSNTHFISPNQGFADDLAGWYKHWLAGADAPAFMSGPRVRYYTMHDGALLDPSATLDTATAWPLPGTAYKRLYLHGGGTLSEDAPQANEGASDSYAYTPAAGTAELLSRWDNAASGSVPMPAWDQRTDEPKGLSFTATFDSPTKIAGLINLHLRATTVTAPDPASTDPRTWPAAAQLAPPYNDTDFVVKVSDVADDGTATLITEGFLRASHRALDEAASELAPNGDVIRAQHFDDSAHIDPPLQGQDTAYDIEIWPTAKVFHRLRIDIYSSDTPGHLTLLKPAINTVLHSPSAQSWLEIPTLPA